MDSLKKYKEKRDFKKTPEPFSSKKISTDSPRFVIQKHDASRLHYDFRLEVNGVLKSWAIPKGPSTDIGQKRLAVPTEDHPIDYIDFEGIIPEGNYGAGTVIVWDTGTYINASFKNNKLISMEEAIEDGHVDIELKGRKLKGEYALIYTGRGKKKFWLFLKKKDEYADSKIDILAQRPESVLSGRTIEELAGDKENKQDI
ncbi:MAG: DNA polymerase ligase N-terminal domain-containing protein [Methanobacterium sp.]